MVFFFLIIPRAFGFCFPMGLVKPRNLWLCCRYIICSVHRLVHILLSFYCRVRQTAGRGGRFSGVVCLYLVPGVFGFWLVVATWQGFVMFARDDGNMSMYSSVGGRGDFVIAV